MKGLSVENEDIKVELVAPIEAEVLGAFGKISLDYHYSLLFSLCINRTMYIMDTQ